MKVVFNHVYNYNPSNWKLFNLYFKIIFKIIILFIIDTHMINYSQYLGPPKVLLLSGVMYYNQHNCIKHISCVNKCETLQKN